MEKLATLNLRVNSTVKQRAEDVLSRLGIPMSTAINTDFMTTEKIHAKLQEGYDDMKAGRVQDATSAFAKFRESH
ncbi:MAG: type II toxin-antitoxin system antitoxin, RelB/DinJ family [Lachnospiraceae bacterium]|nr:type II toxin-antitoxin system antitoxin, RelB/DinJ family [Lachnospiraceae bacterium]